MRPKRAERSRTGKERRVALQHLRDIYQRALAEGATALQVVTREK